MKSQPPLTRVRMIERSVRCFICSLLGLLPVVGLPFAVHALTDYYRTTPRRCSGWNPAAGYRVWGVVLGILGLFMTIIVILVIVGALMEN